MTIVFDNCSCSKSLQLEEPVESTPLVESPSFVVGVVVGSVVGCNLVLSGLTIFGVVPLPLEVEA